MQLAIVGHLDDPAAMCLPRDFTAWLRQARSPKTYDTYVRRLVAAVAEMGCLDDLTEADWLAYIAGRNAPTVKAILCAARAYYHHEEIDDPTAKIPIPRVNSPEVPYFSEEQVAAHIAGMYRVSPMAGRAAEVLAATGLRVGSLCALRTTDLDLERKTLRVRVVKGNRPYTLPLNARAEKALLCQPPAADGRFFPVLPNCVENWCRKASESSGVVMWPHAYRHYFASVLATKTDPRTWAAILGHRNLQLYFVYAAASSDLMRLAMAEVG